MASHKVHLRDREADGPHVSLCGIHGPKWITNRVQDITCDSCANIHNKVSAHG